MCIPSVPVVAVGAFSHLCPCSTSPSANKKRREKHIAGSYLCSKSMNMTLTNGQDVWEWPAIRHRIENCMKIVMENGRDAAHTSIDYIKCIHGKAIAVPVGSSPPAKMLKIHFATAHVPRFFFLSPRLASSLFAFASHLLIFSLNFPNNTEKRNNQNLLLSK